MFISKGSTSNNGGVPFLLKMKMWKVCDANNKDNNDGQQTNFNKHSAHMRQKMGNRDRK